MRLFIGMALPESYQQMLRDIQHKWQGRFRSRLTWTRPGKWHLTLKFLGQSDRDLVPEIKNCLGRLEFHSIYLQGKGCGFFGSRGQYRVIWLGAGGEVQKLKLLADALDRDLRSLGFEPEKKQFKAHLTLARIKNFVASDPWKDFCAYIEELNWPGFKAREVVLWQSNLTPQGPEYSALMRRKLQEPDNQ